MAGKGTYTAYQKLKPIKTDFGKIARDEEDNAFKYREEKRLGDKKIQDEKDKVKFNPLGDEKTGIENLDDALFNSIRTMNIVRHEDWLKARKDPNYAKSDEYLAKNANRANYAKNLKTFTDSYTKFAEKITSMGGDLSQWNADALSEVNGFFKEEKVQFSENKYGEPIALVAEIDPDTNELVLDENGEPKYTETSLAKVLKGTGMYDLVPAVDTAKEVEELGKMLGADLKDKKTGRTIKTEQLWENKREGAKKLVASKLGSVANPSALAKRVWADEMGNSKADWNEDAYNKVLENVTDMVGITYDEKLKINYDFSGENAETARQAKAQEDVITPVVTPDSNTGIPVVAKIPGLEGDKQGYSVSFGKGVLTSKTEGSSELVDNVWIAEDGKMYATKKKAVRVSKDAVSILDEKGQIDKNKLLDITLGGGGGSSGWKVEEVTEPISETDFTNLAKNSKVKKEDGGYYKDGKELKDYLKSQYKDMPKKSASTFNQKEKATSGAGRFNPPN